ncbi:pseudaminic acid cytidylyltransferase [bacterium]|nr:pseudaminic acid cytidylyltransferase [bacterium]
MNIAIILARGGSKRIPRKNIKNFCGKPIIKWPIEIVKKSNLFDYIMVSTDDEEIKKKSESYGANVPFIRPSKLSDDYSTTTEVVSHSIDWMYNQGWKIDSVCCIYATSVFINISDLKLGHKKLNEENWSYIFSATDFEYSVFRSFNINKNDSVKMLFPEFYHSRSQDLPKVFHDAAQFYWGKPEAWLNNLQIFDSHSSFVFLPNSRVRDIDTEDDWEAAENLFKNLDRGKYD